MTDLDSSRAALVTRLELERHGYTAATSQEALLRDLAARLEQTMEALSDALIAKEELAEQATYWRQRAVHAEQQLPTRLRLVRPEEPA